MMRKKKTTPRLKIADVKYMGTEPNVISSNTDVLYALNWYNYFYEVKTAKKWLEEYCKNNKLSLRNTREINMTMCATARMVNNGLDVPRSMITRLHSKIKDKVKPKPVNVVKISTVKFPLFKFEDLLDSFYNGNYKFFEPKAYDLLKSLSARPVDAKSVVHYYTPLLEEVSEGEGYEHLSKKQRKDYIAFLTALLEEANRYSGNEKVVRQRKPRKKKETPIAKKVAKVKYCKEIPDLQIVSVSPEKIVGAKIVWLYNSKYRKITRIEGDSLEVSGTSISKFSSAISKTVRKPEEVLKEFNTGTKAYKDKYFKKMKTKEAAENGRMNDQTVILKVY